MSSPYRTHSVASSTGSLSDDLAFHNPTSFASNTGSYSYGPAASSVGDTSLSDIYSPDLGGGNSRRNSVALGGGGPTTGRGSGRTASLATSSIAGGGGDRRSRARAFSFLSAHHSSYDTSDRSPSGETPFAGGAYDFALDAEDALASDDDEDVGQGGAVEMQPTGVNSREGGGGPRAYRMRFQPLVAVELTWMAVSGAAVTALTLGAVVLAFAG